MNLGCGVAASTVRAEFAPSDLVQDRFGNDRARGISGAQEKDIIGTISHASTSWLAPVSNPDRQDQRTSVPHPQQLRYSPRLLCTTGAGSECDSVNSTGACPPRSKTDETAKIPRTSRSYRMRTNQSRKTSLLGHARYRHGI